MRSSKVKGLVGLALWVLAVVALVLPGVGFIRAVTAKSITLANGPHAVTLPAHQRYGVYVDDTDNSGYTEQCTITDGGRPVRVSDAGWSLSASDTEVLDLEYDTGSGHLVIDCSTSAEHMSTRPVPNFTAMVIGVGLSFLLGVAGFVVLAVWLLDGFASRREQRRREEEANEALPGG